MLTLKQFQDKKININLKIVMFFNYVLKVSRNLKDSTL